MLNTFLSFFLLVLLIGLLRLMGVIPQGYNDYADLALLSMGSVALTIGFQLFLRSLSGGTQPKGTDGFRTVGKDDAAVLSSLKELRDAFQRFSTSNNVAGLQAHVSARLVDMERNLLGKIAAASVAAVEASELSKLRASIAEKEKLLAEKETEESQLKQRVLKESELAKQAEEKFLQAENLARKIESEKASLSLDLSEVKASLAAQLANAANAERQLLNAREECEKLRADGLKTYEHLAPAVLFKTEINSQMSAFHAEASAGAAISIAAWSALVAFGSAQSDPGAKDFQLQIVRRLGLVLAQYWKQKGLSEKERHEQLSLWAKCLNEHADGRYNLFVPGLGTPIDRTRMSCATPATTVHEVLCWQVRNPAGANFSLAEVA